MFMALCEIQKEINIVDEINNIAIASRTPFSELKLNDFKRKNHRNHRH